ncbi:MAG: 3-dehydroquinate synthase [Sphaerochaetaceae bacterium]|nr:3-dehydroquinate synthase [Sphaerochaetaceae bacterium]
MKTLFKYGKAEFKIAENFRELSYEIGNYGNDVLWICDTNTARMVRPLPQPNIIVSPGEGSKNFNTIERIITCAIDSRMTKDSVFLGLGGGMICDVTALAASLFHRGCRCVLVPTTLMAMADACLGGKTGINYRNEKNVVGTLYSPDEVVLCPEMLRSISEKDFYNGLAEITKHALISENRELYEELVLGRQKIVSRDQETVTRLIELSLRVKLSMIENNREDALNLGHIFGYCLETLFDFQKTHGECVAWGISRSTELSYRAGLCDRSFYEEVDRILLPFKYNINYRVPRSNWQVFKNILSKNAEYRATDNKFHVLKAMGDVVSYQAEEKLIKDVVIEGVTYL